jgi:hypothetical protein
MVPLSDSSLDKLRKIFKKVHYHWDGIVPDHVRDEAEVWFSGVTAFPENVRSMGDIPRARILQLSSGTSSSPLL